MNAYILCVCVLERVCVCVCILLSPDKDMYACVRLCAHHAPLDNSLSVRFRPQRSLWCCNATHLELSHLVCAISRPRRLRETSHQPRGLIHGSRRPIIRRVVDFLTRAVDISYPESICHDGLFNPCCNSIVSFLFVSDSPFSLSVTCCAKRYTTYCIYVEHWGSARVDAAQRKEGVCVCVCVYEEINIGTLTDM